MNQRHLTLLLLAAVALAEDNAVNPGKALYERAGSCIACHQANGQGIPGAFPPLTGSEWVTGDKATLIRIADHGLEGEISVGGQVYRGVMPGQGSQYNDIELAQLLTYIRKSFGNNSEGIWTDVVAEQRRLDAKRGEKPWTAEELKPSSTSSTLGHARTRLFVGAWLDVPGTDGLQPVREVEGLFDRSLVPATGALLQTEGTLTATTAGNLQVLLRSNQPTRVSVDGRAVLRTPLLVGNDKPIAVPRVATVPIAAGEHRLRVEVLVAAAQAADVQAVALVPGMATPVILAGDPDQPLKIDQGEGGLDLNPTSAGEPLLYRGMFPGGLTSNRSIGVGFPGGQSLCFDAINATWSMIWRGPFATGRHHWSGRGMGYREWPQGDAIALLPDEPPLAILTKLTDPWPSRCDTDSWPAGYRFLGYDLESQGRPVFRYQVGKATVSDRPEPIDGGLRRHLRIEGAEGGLTFRAAAGKSLVADKPGTWVLDHHVAITVTPPPGVALRSRTVKGRSEILVDLPAAVVTTCTVTYRWKDTP